MTIDVRAPAGTGNPGMVPGLWFGLYPATVTDNQDPDHQGRVKIALPWAPDGSGAYAAWARLATTMAGKDRGSWFVPDNEDEVLVGFGGGNPDHPYVVGALWNGKDTTPTRMQEGNDVKSLVSRSGIRITLDDTDGAVTLTLETPGKQKLTLTDTGTNVTLEDSNGNSLEMQASGITLTTQGSFTVNAATANLSCPSVTSGSGQWSHTGMFMSSVVQTPSVIGSSYTPGAGNIW
jgi:uncharacterized protein involved in type VI secretion and phage assembly